MGQFRHALVSAYACYTSPGIDTAYGPRLAGGTELADGATRCAGYNAHVCAYKAGYAMHGTDIAYGP
eukprot:3577202-Rhodomonas_salina.1